MLDAPGEYFVARYVSSPSSSATETAGDTLLAGDIADYDHEPAAVPLLQLRPSGGLLLLGEPGMGKTRALECLTAAWAKSGLIAPAPVCLDLDSVTGDTLFEARVAKRLTQRLAREAESIDPGAPPVLCVLDNVDRCGLRPAQLVESLVDLLGTVSARLCLVLACRTTDWPPPRKKNSSAEATRTEKALSDRLPGFTTRHLLPLSLREVAELAIARKLDPEAFLREVHRVAAMPLACIPQTAQMLADRFASSGKLTNDPVELFETTLLEFARDPDPDRAGGPPRGTTRSAGLAAHRLAVSARIAAWTILCERTSIQTTDAPGEDGDLTLTDFLGPEPFPHEQVPGLDQVHDALSSTIFTSRGPYRRMLRHPTFAAFLTARFLADQKIGEDRLRHILLGPGEITTVRPLLRDTAAWLVAHDPKAYGWILDADLETIAAYRYAMASARLRPLLADGLLTLGGQEALRSYKLTGYALSSLGHPGLEHQLRAALTQGPPGRTRIATEIALATGATGVLDELSLAARDEAQPADVRVAAVRTIGSLDPTGAAARLRTVLLEGGERLPDELRGALLNALWPGGLSADELAQAMTRERSPRVFGLYALFIHQLPDVLDDADLPAVLRWAAGRNPRPSPALPRTRPSREIANRLVSRAWHAADREPLLPALAELIHAQIFTDHGISWPGRIPSEERDTRDRRALLLLVVKELTTSAEAARLAHGPISTSLGLARREDLAWMLNQERSADEAHAALWHTLLRSVFDPTNAQHRQLATHSPDSRAARVLEPLLAGTRANLPIPPRAATPQAARAESAHRQPDPATLEAALAALAELLTAAGSGDTASFPRLCLLLQSDPHDPAPTYLWDVPGDDLTLTPGFKALLENDQSATPRLLDSAAAFIEDQHPYTDEWIDTPGTWHLAANSGYVAFAALLRYRPDGLDRLSPRTWETWAPAIVAHSVAGGSPDAVPVKTTLLRLLARTALQSAQSSALRILTAAESAGRTAHEIGFAAEYWSEEFATTLAEKLDTLTWRTEPNNFQLVSHLLLRQHHTATFDQLCARLDDDRADTNANANANAGADANAGERAGIAAILLAGQSQGAWPTVNRAMHADPAWGRTLAIRLARSDYSSTAILASLADAQLAELYRWCLQYVPPEEDSWEEQTVNPFHNSHELEFWRERSLRILVDRATPSALREVTALVRDNPQRPWMRRALVEAQEAIQTTTTHYTPSPAELHTLVRASGRRIIRDSTDLLELVLDELGGLQKAMHGMPAEARFLWDEQRSKDGPSHWRPKHEPDVSDYIARHLRDHLEARGVFTDREVQVGRTSAKPSAVGERIDLLCQVSTPEGRLPYREPCRVVIEIKGPWNKDIDTGARTQLTEYMRAAKAEHGIYLASWYPRNEWDPEDYRRDKPASRLDRDQLETKLNVQTEAENARTGSDIRAFVLNLERRDPYAHED